MTPPNDLKNLQRILFSMSIEEAQGDLETNALRAAVSALRQIEQRATIKAAAA
jgi:hypothetical protein